MNRPRNEFSSSVVPFSVRPRPSPPPGPLLRGSVGAGVGVGVGVGVYVHAYCVYEYMRVGQHEKSPHARERYTFSRPTRRHDPAAPGGRGGYRGLFCNVCNGEGRLLIRGFSI
jgi:hypothetical protein